MLARLIFYPFSSPIYSFPLFFHFPLAHSTADELSYRVFVCCSHKRLQQFCSQSPFKGRRELTIISLVANLNVCKLMSGYLMEYQVKFYRGCGAFECHLGTFPWASGPDDITWWLAGFRVGNLYRLL